MELKDQLDELLRRSTEAAEVELETLKDIDRAMFSNDAQVRGEIERIITQSHARKADIVRRLEYLASMIGRYPPAEVAHTAPPPIPRQHQVNGHYSDVHDVGYIQH